MYTLFKYPRTLHCPWSEGITNDDKVHSSMDQFHGHEVVVTEKMDGENTTMYCDYYHARSLDSKHHPSRNYVKQLWGNKVKHVIPKNWRLCGENLYARHSIAYDNLEDYFYGFSLWDDTNTCLDWDFTVDFFNSIGITPVKVIYRGIYNEDAIKNSWNSNNSEGYVIRPACSVPYEKFGKYFAKFVRKNHVQTDTHWMKAEIVKNKLK